MECNDYKENFITSTWRNSMNLFILLIVTSISFCVSAQSNSAINKPPFKVISYGEKIQFGNVESSAKWTISNTKENIVAFVSGNQINEYVFEESGNYEIIYSEIKKHDANECSHAQFEDKMTVLVSPVKMTFDFSKIVFSEKIRKGSNCDGIFITVPVNVTMKENTPIKFTIPNVMVAGVGSEIIAKPVSSEVLLKNGTQFFKYQLSGTANKEAYLMFDFVDVNNTIQTYYQPEIVK